MIYALFFRDTKLKGGVIHVKQHSKLGDVIKYWFLIQSTCSRRRLETLNTHFMILP